jgi:hypothetical protein
MTADRPRAVRIQLDPGGERRLEMCPGSEDQCPDKPTYSCAWIGLRASEVARLPLYHVSETRAHILVTTEVDDPHLHRITDEVCVSAARKVGTSKWVAVREIERAK